MFWYRQKYHIPLNDPRLLDTSYEEMLDDFEACRAYDRMARGETDEQEYDSDLSEGDILDELDDLDGTEHTESTEDWIDADPVDLLRELDAL